MEKKRLEELLKKWQKIYEDSLKKLPEREKDFSLTSKIPIKPVYTPLDFDSERYEEKLSLPGIFPFTRGIHPTMYRSRLWTMRQYAGFGTAEETNKRYHYLLSQGQTGLSVAFDLPTQLGYDSDHPRAKGEIGKVGVAISSLADMEILFKGIDLNKISTSMTINATCCIILAMYYLLAEKQGADLKNLSGTVQNDILKEYVARGCYIFPPRPSMRLVSDVIIWCNENLPRFNPISVSGYHIREAGANAVQEIAFTLADGLEYIKEVVKRGIDINKFAPRISFFFAAHSNILEEVAKFRAARRLWARLLRERYQANDEACRLRFHTQTGGVTLTAAQPENNIIRVAYQALAAVLGGTQSLHTNSFDEALCLPTEKAVTIALRTQQILAYESGVADVCDPLAGSYFVESLTDEIEKRAEEIINEIENLGGATKAVEIGYIQEKINESAYEYQKELESGKRKVVGVNCFQEEKKEKYEILRIDESLEKKRIEELRDYKKNRNQIKLKEAMKRLKEVAQSEENIMPAVIEAVRN
ncbi:MAG: methylmalonyl-CoA mutase family protein, partial [candidate division WOR-3 bacterium]|nr:methylmalonyl-CoA mutase family protein [candidate division WOR-3 bacterium]